MRNYLGQTEWRDQRFYVDHQHRGLSRHGDSCGLRTAEGLQQHIVISSNAGNVLDDSDRKHVTVTGADVVNRHAA